MNKRTLCALHLTWAVIRGYRRLVFLNAALWFVYFLVPLLSGLLLQVVFNDLARPHPSEVLVWEFLALMIAVSVAGYLSTYLRIVIDNVVQFGVAARLRANMLGYLLRRPGAEALPSSPGEAVSRFRDDVGLVTGFLFFPMLLTGGLGFGIVAFVIMVRIDAFITLVVVAPLLGIVVGTQVLATRLQSYRSAAREATGQVTGYLGEVLGATLAVKVAGAEPSVLRRFTLLNAERKGAAIRDQVLAQVLDGAYTSTAQLGTGLMLLLAAHAMREHRFTVGDFALFVSYLEWLTAIPLFLGRFLSGSATLAVSFGRMEELMEGAPEQALIRETPAYPTAQPDTVRAMVRAPLEQLTATGLTYHYPGADRGIDDVGLTIARGELVVITGRFGSGKSTLLRVLLGLLPREAGEVRWNGEPLEDLAHVMIPPRVAYTAQVPRLFSGTLRQNILLGLPTGSAQIAEAVQVATLEPDVSSMTRGLDTEVGRRGVQLSGGQVQRTAVARMLIRSPNLLVLDDVSSALDAGTERILWQQLLDKRRETVLAVSHRRMTLERANRVIVLQAGRVAATGPLSKVLKESGEARAIYEDAGT